METKPKDVNLYGSFMRAASVLTALSEHSVEGLRMIDISRALGLGKSSTHRLLAGMASAGLVEQDGATSRYFVGTNVLRWAVSAQNRFDLARIADGAMGELAESSGDTVYLSVRAGDSVVCVAMREGLYPIKTLILKIGDKLPLGIGGGGLAVLAFLPEEEIEEVLVSGVAQRAPYGQDEAVLRNALAKTRKTGFAVNEGYIVPGMITLGVPIRDISGRAVAAISIAAISDRMERPRREEIARQMLVKANEIEAISRVQLSTRRAGGSARGAGV